MATPESKSPSFFNFLKEGLLLPTHNKRLFAAVFAIIVASSYLHPLGNDLADQQPLTGENGIDGKAALNGTDPRSREFLHLIQEIMDDTRNLLTTGAVDHLVSMSIEWVTQIIVLFAAVATYSGELQHTLASLLGKAKAKLKGPLLTLAFVHALALAGAVLLPAMSKLLTFLVLKQRRALLLLIVLGVLFVLLVIVAAAIVLYFTFVCSLSVVVAAAESGCHGAGAVGRAWRLVKRTRLRAVLFIVLTVVLDATIWPALGKMASAGMLLRFVSNILKAAVEVLHGCTMTAFYYDCKGAPRHRISWSLPKTLLI